MEEALLRVGIPYKVVGGHALLRPPRDQGCPRLPEGGDQPGRRGVGEAGAQRAQAGRRRQLRRAARRLGHRPRRAVRRGAALGPGGRRHRPGHRRHRRVPAACSTTSSELRADGPGPHARGGARAQRLPRRAPGRALRRGRRAPREPGRADRLRPGVRGRSRSSSSRSSLVADTDDLPDPRERLGRPDDHARREGPRVPQRLHPRHGGRRVPAPPCPRRAGRDRGGAAALLRRHHPGPPAPLPHERVEPHALRVHPVQPAEPVPRRDPRRAPAHGRGLTRPAAPPGAARGPVASCGLVGLRPHPGHGPRPHRRQRPQRPRPAGRDRPARPAPTASGSGPATTSATPGGAKA